MINCFLPIVRLNYESLMSYIGKYVSFMKEVDWTDLQYFLAIAETGTLAAAAKQMGASQATVWRRIRSLQSALGVSLFDEQHSGHVLSAAGLELMAAVGRMENDLGDVLQRLTTTRMQLHGEVRVTAPEFIGTSIIAPCLTELLYEHPHLTIELLLRSPSSSLSERVTDIALLFELPSQSRFQVASTFAIPFGLYASQSYINSYGRPVSVNNLTAHSLVEFEQSVGHIAPKQWLTRAESQPVITFRSSSPHARAAAVIAGVGLGLFPTCLVQQWPQLQCVIGSDQVGSLQLLLLINNGVARDPRVKVVTAFLASALTNNGCAYC